MLAKKCLKLWALVGKKRANTCELGNYYKFEIGRNDCPCSKGSLNAHHIESFRMNKALRFASENCLVVCPGHHLYFSDSAHRSFATVYQYMSANRPDDLLYLLDHYRDKAEITKEYLEDKISSFQCELNVSL